MDVAERPGVIDHHPALLVAVDEVVADLGRPGRPLEVPTGEHGDAVLAAAERRVVDLGDVVRLDQCRPSGVDPDAVAETVAERRSGSRDREVADRHVVRAPDENDRLGVGHGRGRLDHGGEIGGRVEQEPIFARRDRHLLDVGSRAHANSRAGRGSADRGLDARVGRRRAVQAVVVDDEVRIGIGRHCGARRREIGAAHTKEAEVGAEIERQRRKDGREWPRDGHATVER